MRFVLLLILWAVGLAQAAGQDAAPHISTTANGEIVLTKVPNAAVYAEFEKSDSLTKRLRDSLIESGFALAQSRDGAQTVLVFSGDIVVSGGPKFTSPVKMPIGVATEKTIETAQQQGSNATSAAPAVFDTGVALAVQSGALGAISNFSKGLALGTMAESIGKSTGLRGWFNKAVAGDPRGVCLARCEDWNKADQSVYLRVKVTGPGGDQEIRSVSKLHSETLAPELVIEQAIGAALANMKVVVRE